MHGLVLLATLSFVFALDCETPAPVAAANDPAVIESDGCIMISVVFCCCCLSKRHSNESNRPGDSAPRLGGHLEPEMGRGSCELISRFV